MSIVLTTEQREQAGSDSYNRFEYQVHWIVCHIIGKLQEDAECIVFCEFHDDMAEFSTCNQQYQFYQIKTKTHLIGLLRKCPNAKRRKVEIIKSLS